MPSLPTLVPFPLGALPVPEGWDVQVQVTLRESSRVVESVAPQRAGEAKKSTANIVVSRYRTDEPDAKSARELFLRRGALGASALAEEDRGELTCPDGAPATWVQIAFDSGSGVRLLQRHLFRRELDRTLTHLVATVDDGRRAELSGDLADRLGRFTLDP